MIQTLPQDLEKEKQYFISKYPDLHIPKDVGITEYIMPFLRRNSDSVIFIDGNNHREYTAGQMADSVDKFACQLSRMGYKKGDVVGILMHNVPEYFVAFHGALSLVEEAGKTLGTTNPRCLISQSLFVDKINEIKTVIPVIQDFIIVGDPLPNTITYQSMLENDGIYPRVKIDGFRETAILPFSSGTTGLPKGVMLTHYNMIANALQVQTIETTNFRADEVVLGITPYFHIYGMLFFMLLSPKIGAKAVTMARFEPELYLQLVQKYRVTTSYIAPPVAVMFAKHPLMDKYDVSSLRMLFSGSAPLSATVEKAIAERFNGKIQIKQAYGLTEASPAIFVQHSIFIKPGSSGMLLPNLTLKIVDLESGRLCKVGERGEICVRGPNVMKGYYNNEKATNEMIDQDDFLHTGDVGYVDADGCYYLEDRIKELIKYKGFQVPPAELEGILLQHPSIIDAAVIGIPDEDSGELPKAFVVLRPNHTLTETEVCEYLKPQVAYYKQLRGGVTFIEAIPKTASGKILRRDLRLISTTKHS
eukprot:gene2614-3005_t